MFVVHCDHKDCRKEMAPVLDRDTNEVLCTECDRPINSITIFAKNQMVSLGQTKKSEAKQQAFAVECIKCKKKAQPKLKDDKLLCSFCTKELDNISAPYANSIKLFLSSQR